MKRDMRGILLALSGALLAAIGMWLVGAGEARGLLRALPYALVGLGCGLAGHGLGGAFGAWADRRDPQAARRRAIEANDERNAAIRRHAKARAYDAMVFVFGALMVAFALMEVEMAATISLVAAYLFVVGYGIFLRARLEKEM